MNKKAVCMNIAVPCLLLLFGCAAALGDTISLSQVSTAGFTFSSTSPSSSSVAISIWGDLSSSAVLTTSSGASLGTFTITQSAAASPLTMSLAHPQCPNPNFWRIRGGPLSFTFSDGSDTLTGNLRLKDLAQAPGGGLTANVNDTLAVNLFHLGGNLASSFGKDAVVNFTLDFPTSERLDCLLASPPATTHPGCPVSGPTSITSAFDHGTVDPSPTPEPASLSLFGIGMIGLAFALRRHMKAAAR